MANQPDPSKTPVTVWVRRQTLSRLKAMAAREGVPYTTFMARLLSEFSENEPLTAADCATIARETADAERRLRDRRVGRRPLYLVRSGEGGETEGRVTP